ncbi:nicotinic acid phosphoribosyltransferase [Mesoplasma florum L1]|uniref:nicotinate phosphoribosyltransferase n=1 Tax=Mesoplasma florum (strain ATCC 33453 / NBRC 100688 / NCTC 11704 / L1) TaxID=265311 RepID=Q6F0M7_MESFL|nr:nicotinate phosphoribosyltransferase [Mesoplasma florum]AAT75946.1 nicotinic acid phosphoribosyltransferase [Mesoplasma florum L1]ATI73552.1 nicotinate phosphoribosyltransferase [Mesoplasma florum]ATI74242.1 nicotinate phosphoribosyltransferase [Mesoplasma florum]AVN61945.1 nicotinate phosphoribosyltransferase [Mesoplasma florum]
MNKINFDKKIKDGYYIADYFKKTSLIINNEFPNSIVTMQFFQRKNNITLSGINEVIQLLEFACKDYKNLKIWALKDGDIINANEPVLKIEGNYSSFGWLEGMIDGILARNSCIATNSSKIVKAANGKPVLNMMDRADSYLTLPSDGYSSWVGGIKLFVTEASVELIDDSSVPKPSGTMPHALIQAFDGDILKATEAFYRNFPESNLLSLVDYNNDCVRDSVKVANHFKEKLWAIRIDTSGNLIDKYLEENRNKYPENANLYGVNQYLIKEVRKALDESGNKHVKIIVSSGLTEEKIKEFENNNTPVDIYGVGGYLAKIDNNFTGDAVLINGKEQAKFGRKNIASDRLTQIK